MVTVAVARRVGAPPHQAYEAFTRALYLHEWLCDFATVDPRVGGRIYLYWHAGSDYACGEFLALAENRSVAFTWLGRGDNAPGQVEVELAPNAGGTLIQVHHATPGADESGARAAALDRRWTEALANLAAVLETGLDPRTWERPLLGIGLTDYDATIARSLGVPVADGLRLDSVVHGLGAEAAGLGKDDVLVEMAGAPLRSDFGSLVAALENKRAGDRVEVIYYRGPDRRVTTMELSRRPVPTYPDEPSGLAEAVRASRANSLAALEAALLGVDDARAGRSPAPGEWSAKDTLAHLVQAERTWLGDLGDLIGGYERISDAFGGNITAAIRATVAAYPTVDALLEELRHLAAEAAAFAAALPPELVARKSTYRTAASLLLGAEEHTGEHVAQISAAVAAARGAGA